MPKSAPPLIFHWAKHWECSQFCPHRELRAASWWEQRRVQFSCVADFEPWTPNPFGNIGQINAKTTPPPLHFPLMKTEKHWKTLVSTTKHCKTLRSSESHWKTLKNTDISWKPVQNTLKNVEKHWRTLLWTVINTGNHWEPLKTTATNAEKQGGSAFPLMFGV